MTEFITTPNGDAPAHPHTGEENRYGHCTQWPGLTKRELIAAMAMQGYMASDCRGEAADFAAWSVKQADALLAELAKPREVQS
jgi:hypothetical protein